MGVGCAVTRQVLADRAIAARILAGTGWTRDISPGGFLSGQESAAVQRLGRPGPPTATDFDSIVDSINSIGEKAGINIYLAKSPDQVTAENWHHWFD